MGSVKDVKAALAGVIEQNDGQIQQIRKLIDATDRQIAWLRMVTRGAAPGRTGYAVRRMEQSRQHLVDASALVASYSDEVRAYIKVLG